MAHSVCLAINDNLINDTFYGSKPWAEKELVLLLSESAKIKIWT